MISGSKYKKKLNMNDCQDSDIISHPSLKQFLNDTLCIVYGAKVHVWKSSICHGNKATQLDLTQKLFKMKYNADFDNFKYKQQQYSRIIAYRGAFHSHLKWK